ncbi:MAG: ATP-grasp domain-containing protein [Pseudomonadota bacterium]
MQWILQEFEDTTRLAAVLDRMDIPFTLHKVVPFIGELDPAPVIGDPNRSVLFGSYTLWRYAEKHKLSPGVFRLSPFVEEAPWHPHLLNGADALFLSIHDIPSHLTADGPDYFIRPVSDSKEVAGSVKSSSEIITIAAKVLALSADEIVGGALDHDTPMMLTRPQRILKEWRLWVVDERVVTYSLYKEGRRVVYRPEIDEDALAFAKDLIAANPDYARAYVLDVCRTNDGLRMIETNCINAAGFYAADLARLVLAIEKL